MAKIARFLAPIALAAVGVGVYLIVHSTIVHNATTATQSSNSSVAKGPPQKARKHRRLPKFYTVKSGDTLSQISSRTGVSVARLTDLNRSLSASPNSLQTGQRLRLRR
ncbi:MAG TPA: LysM domain-containing protein [Solirubrobacteraceae bacterium]|nr:LysM domain-containing protein [Solirubrobacteraceae bacterium]